MSEYDCLIVGSGINALVAADMLGKKRRTTLMLERSAAIGGCLRTEAATAPGFVHDIMATTLVLFRTSPAYEALGKDLEARGFAFADTDLPAGVLRPGGSVNHRTFIPNAYHIGASTHPGPGLGGASGFLLGSSLN